VESRVDAQRRVYRIRPEPLMEVDAWLTPFRWELEPLGSGTRVRLWHSIDRRYISWGAAGWHVCFDVLERLLAGEPIGRIVEADAMKFDGWQRLTAEYARQFGVEAPGWPTSPAKP
jgi:hypothetical protein